MRIHAADTLAILAVFFAKTYLRFSKESPVRVDGLSFLRLPSGVKSRIALWEVRQGLKGVRVCASSSQQLTGHRIFPFHPDGFDPRGGPGGRGIDSIEVLQGWIEESGVSLPQTAPREP